MVSRKRLYAGAANVMLLLFLACEMVGPESGGSGLDGKAAVSISIEATGIQGPAAGSGRTVLPTVGLETITTWELWGEKAPDSETRLGFFSGSSSTVYLEAGTWDFTLKGYRDDALLLQGVITSRPITFDGPNNLSFTVTPILEGKGTFRITINLPVGHGITAAKILQDNVEIDGAITPDADNAIVFEGSDYPAGDYFFSVQLYQNTDLYGVVSELTQVRGNLWSEKTYTLTLEDLSFTYTITYHLNEGEFDSTVENPGHYQSTGKDSALPIPTRPDYIFDGWHDNEYLTESAITVIPQGSTGDKDFYAKWIPVMPTTSLQAALDWLDVYAAEGGSYTITLQNDETIAPKTLSYSGKNIDITILGDTSERTLSLSSTGSLFTVGSGVTLTLGANVALEGRSDNWVSLLRVDSGGTLVMNTGSKISGNPAYYGGGVYVSGGTFTMSGGEISGNPASYGGGVYVSGGTFTMSGGEISGNTASYGGGVYVNGGTFTKQSGGVIYGSNASDSSLRNVGYGDGYGHAVYVSSDKKRNTTAGTGITLNSEISGSAGGWTDISGITYSSVLGGAWTLQSDGRYRSPVIGHNSVTKMRVGFTSPSSNTSITIQLDVSSEANYDYAFIGALDNPSAIYNDSSNYQSIAGTNSVTVTIPVSGSGSHFVDIGYRKDGLESHNSDCAWFQVIENRRMPISIQIGLQPALNDPSLSNTSLSVSESAEFSVEGDYTSWTWYWDGDVISGENASSYFLEAGSKNPGIYELSVIVATDTGERLSAGCRLVIRAN